MRDWQRWVEERLPSGPWDEPARRRIVADLAAMLEDCARAERERGASATAARAAAERQIGEWSALGEALEESDQSVAEWRRRARRSRRRRRRAGALLAGLLQDWRTALRALRREPVFALTVLATLTVGIGATLAIFSVVDAALLEPLPYQDPERLVRLFSTHPEEGVERAGVSTGDVRAWRERNTVLAGIGAWFIMGRTLVTDESPEIVNVGQVSQDYFAVLGVPPLLGRTFTAEETARATFDGTAAPTGADPVLVLSHRAWLQRFGGDPQILERKLVLERRTWRVVGVMPPTAQLPRSEVELWIPWSFEGERPHDQRYLAAVARLERGVSLDQAAAQMNGIAAALGEELPASNEGWRIALVPLADELVGSSRQGLLVIFGSVLLVLLVACANIACLQLARLGERQRDVALRLALGASRWRIARQFLVESALLATVGCGLALLLAVAARGALTQVLPADLALLAEPRFDPGLLALALGLTAAVTVSFGLLPLLAGLQRDPAAALGEASGRAAGGAPRWERLRRGLVVAEVASAVVLVVATGLLVRSFLELGRVDLGFRPDRVAILPVTLNSSEYSSGAKTRAYYRQLLERLAAVPGVESVGAVTALPMSPIGPDFDRPAWAEGEPPPPGGARTADVRMATPGYFETLGIELVAGRVFSEADTPTAPRVVVVNERLARREWPGADPVGRRLVIDYSTAGTYPYEVVGVVGDVHFDGARAAPRPEVYLPHAQRSYLVMNVAVRASGDPSALIPRLRREVLALDPLQPAYRVGDLRTLVAGSYARDRLATRLVGGFGAVALGLALLGIFGVLSHQVARRTREMGVRTALGASRREIVRMVVSSGLRLTASGVTLGVLLAAASTRALETLLFRVTPLDPLIFGLALALVLTGAALASWLPARRAGGVDPVVALRHE